jgi:hypothetical protein
MSFFSHENSNSKFYIVTKSKVAGHSFALTFKKQLDNEHNRVYENLGRDLKDIIKVHVICFSLFLRKYQVEY